MLSWPLYDTASSNCKYNEKDDVPLSVSNQICHSSSRFYGCPCSRNTKRNNTRERFKPSDKKEDEKHRYHLVFYLFSFVPMNSGSSSSTSKTGNRGSLIRDDNEEYSIVNHRIYAGNQNSISNIVLFAKNLRTIHYHRRRRHHELVSILFLCLIMATYSKAFVTKFTSFAYYSKRKVPSCHFRGISSAASSLSNGGDNNESSGNIPINPSNDPSNSPPASSSTHENSKYYISPEKISQIKSQADILTVIESYNLPKFTRLDNHRATALCPFHNDHNPSLSIDNDRGLFKCFSCGAGGDVFQFVREYHNISQNKKGEKKMSFRAAVEIVAKEYTNIIVDNAGTKNKPMSESKRRKIQQEEDNKRRIRLANSAAADFYANLLITSQEAGLARSHLRERGITPLLVRTFGLGYAPDVYFGVANSRGMNSGSSGNAKKKMKDWGKGSCVERLKDLGFSPREIVDAGLASITSLARTRLENKKKKDILSSVILETSSDGDGMDNISNSTATVEEAKGRAEKKEVDDDDLDYSDIMDRFRGRIMVPIFDKEGKNVVAFGGRHLEVPSSKTKKKSSSDNIDTSSSAFKAAKYLNSPESLIFSKKNLLYGLHTANLAIEKMEKDNEAKSINSGDRVSAGATNLMRLPSSIVIVEGYFDAITLYGAGVREVVASMGAALSLEQLELAANVGGAHSGRIILCLDGDEAGLSAIERLCTGNILWDLLNKNVVDVVVATLPPGVKDPAEFIEAKGGLGSSVAGDAFREEVLKEAKPWADWYINRLITNYDSGEEGNFSDICDRISAFLSTFPNPGDRTRRAYEAAGFLANSIILKSNRGTGSSALRIQLESDLLDMASRKAMAREAISRRIEAANGILASDSKDLIAKMSSGEGITSLPEKYNSTEKSKNLRTSLNHRSSQSMKKRASRYLSQAPNKRIISRDDRRKQFGSGSYRKGNTNFGNRGMRLRQQQDPLTEHFSGFKFREEDAAWLGIPADKWKKERSLLLGNDYFGQQRRNYQHDKTNNDIVYFNSNQYLGNEYITSDALNAGYGNKEILIEDSNTRFGTENILTQDANYILNEAEERLLKIMVEFAPARQAMKAALATNFGSGPAIIEWNSLDREWLFHCLTDAPGHEPLPSELQDGGTILQLREHLSCRPDVPTGAFSSVPSEIDKEMISKKILRDGNADGPNKAGAINETDYATESRNEQNDEFPKTGSIHQFHPNDQEMKTKYADDMKIFESDGHLQDTFKEGSLDKFFSENDDIILHGIEGAINREMRAELNIQEILATMLRATAIKRMLHLKNQWKTASDSLLKRSDIDRQNLRMKNETLTNEDLSPYDLMEVEELSSLCNSLCGKVSEAMRIVHELTESSKRVGSRLLDYCSDDGVEGKMSTAKQEELAKMLDDHLASLPKDKHRPKSPGDDGEYIFGSDEYEDHIDSKFGGFKSNERVTPQPQGTSSEKSEVHEEPGFLDQEFINMMSSLPESKRFNRNNDYQYRDKSQSNNVRDEKVFERDSDFPRKSTDMGNATRNDIADEHDSFDIDSIFE